MRQSHLDKSSRPETPSYNSLDETPLKMYVLPTMHELSLATDIVEQVTEVARLNNATKVTLVRLLVGPLSGVIAESLQFCFNEACHNSLADGAKLEIEHSPLLINCNKCQKTNEVSPHALICPDCHTANVLVTSGKEFRIIDMEVL